MSIMFPEQGDGGARASRIVNELVILAFVGVIIAILLIWSMFK